MILNQQDSTALANVRLIQITSDFATQLARALILQRPRLVIDRPGAMLYDVPYSLFIRQLAAQAGLTGTWEIYDFSWNRALYSE